LPIGAVALVQDYVCPSYVGFDIGCGMTFMNVGFYNGLDKETMINIHRKILDNIPVGFNENVGGTYHRTFHSATCNKELTKTVNDKLGKQYGTLGSGNHFIEIGTNQYSQLCITIHSGSRRPGWLIGNWYMNKAKEQIGEPYKKFFKLESELGQAYLHDMDFALKYALDNREKMLKIVCDILGVKMEVQINENHNHAVDFEDDGVVLHRKGATPADLNQLGVIPGSMKTGTYITKGLGNEEYLSSASHGAGRKMSRGFAKRNISMTDFKEQMSGIVANISEATLDEAPDAYKDLEYVINAQRGIVVDVIDHITPLINVKG
jgi:tRNA-splicing ligase RtcB